MGEDFIGASSLTFHRINNSSASIIEFGFTKTKKGKRSFYSPRRRHALLTFRIVRLIYVDRYARLFRISLQKLIPHIIRTPKLTIPTWTISSIIHTFLLNSREFKWKWKEKRKRVNPATHLVAINWQVILGEAQASGLQGAHSYSLSSLLETAPNTLRHPPVHPPPRPNPLPPAPREVLALLPAPSSLLSLLARPFCGQIARRAS